MTPPGLQALGLFTILGLLACVDTAPLAVPKAPDGSQSMLLLRECNRRLTVRAGALPAADVALTETRCEGELRTWMAYLPLSLDAYGFEPGEISLTACPTNGLVCCTRRPLGSLSFDALYEGGEDAITGELTAWPTALATIEVQSRCICGRFEDISLVELPGVERGRIAKIDDERFLLLSLDRVTTQGARSSIRVLEMSDLDGAQVELGAPELGTFPVHGFTIDRDLQGRIAVGSSSTSVLFGDLSRGLRWSAPLPVGHNTVSVRLSPESGPEPVFAALSEFHADELWVFRDGRWTNHAEPALMAGSCRGGVAGNGQRPEIVWLGPDELLAMPHAFDLYAGNQVATATTHPHGFWHLRGETVRWIRGPDPETDCLKALSFLPGYGVTVGTRQGELHVWDKDAWSRLELAHPDGPPEWKADVFGIGALDGGFVFGGREGYLSYVQDRVLCANLKPSFFHLRSMVPMGDELIISTDARAAMGDSQIVRLRLVR